MGHSPPEELLVFSWDNTVGPPRIKERMFRELGIGDYTDFNERFERYEATLPAKVLERSTRHERRLRFMYSEMATGNLKPITVEDMRNFGAMLKPYDGVERMIERHRGFLAMRGVTLRVAILTSAPEPVIAATSLGKVVDVVKGQRFQDKKVEGVVVAKASKPFITPEAKPDLVMELQKKWGISPRATVFMGGNGRSDRPAMLYVARGHGTAIGVIGGDRWLDHRDERALEHAKADRDAFLQLKATGRVNAVVRADYEPDSWADRALLDTYTRHALVAAFHADPSPNMQRFGPGEASGIRIGA